MIGKKGKGAKYIELPPMNIKDYGELPFDTVNLFKFRVRGLEHLRAGSFLQYNLLQNEKVLVVLVEFHQKQIYIATTRDLRQVDVKKLVHESPNYTNSPDLNYEVDFEELDEVAYVDILKHRFNLEFNDE